MSSLIDSFEACVGAKVATPEELQAALEVVPPPRLILPCRVSLVCNPHPHYVSFFVVLSADQARGQTEAAEALALPPPNPYVVSCIDILGDSQPEPTIVLSCLRGTAWHWPRPDLREPRVRVLLHLSVPWSHENAATFIGLRCILEVS